MFKFSNTAFIQFYVSLVTSFLCVVLLLVVVDFSLVPIFLLLLQATEGKCWKRRIEIVIREYHKWRTYFKKRVRYHWVVFL